MKARRALFGIFTITAAFAMQVHAQDWLTNGLIAYYPFNGNANDVACTNHGTVVGATLTMDRFGIANAAYYFDGASWIETLQYRLLDGASNATISAWVMIQSGGGQLLAAGDDRSGYDPISCRISEQSGDAVWFQDCQVGTGPVPPRIGAKGCPYELADLTAGTWHQISIVLRQESSPPVLLIYVDGRTNHIQIGSDSGANDFWKISYDRDMRFLIGALEGRPGYSTPDQFWTGSIDDIRIYNRALPDSEVRQLYHFESSICPVPFIASETQSQLGYWGKSVTFRVGAVGTPPLSYQWLKDNVPIAGATGSSLVLTNLQMADAGYYSAAVSNDCGTNTGSGAYLTVNPAGVGFALYPGITIDGVVGLTYGIQYTTNLSNTNSWQGAANVTLSVPTMLWFDVHPATQPQRYYRVVPGPITIP